MLILLLLPVGVVMLFFFLGGIAILVVQSFQIYVPGRIIQISNELTLENYVEYFGRTAVYYGFLWDTLRLSGIAVAISVLIAYPLAYKIVRTKSVMIKKILLTAIVTSFFLNGIVKVYSWVVVLGDTGLVNSAARFIGLHGTRLLGTDSAVIIGLVYFLSPIAAMALIGPIKNVDPSLEESSMNLGADLTKTFFRVTLPLSMPGIIAATLLTYALGVSAFMIPAFLGRGIVLFMSNIVYNRFSDTFNYPGGAALGVVLLAITILIAYGVNKIMTTRLKWIR